MTLPHRGFSFNKDIISVIGDPVHDCFGNRASFIIFRIDTAIPFSVVILCAEDHGTIGTVNT